MQESSKRNYQKEYQAKKEKHKQIACMVSPTLFDDFTAKCELNNTTKNAIIKQWIEEYTYNQ